MRARILNCLSQRLASIAISHSTAGASLFPHSETVLGTCIQMFSNTRNKQFSREWFLYESCMMLSYWFVRMAAVVLMNQVTTKINHDKSSYLAPALGESWAHACTNRMMLTWENGERIATLIKSPSRKRDSKPYQVTAQGVRGLGNKRPRSAAQEGQGQENLPPAQVRKC
jgi:hypothetical protein